jgi:ubiquinone biosynthesis protein
MTNNLFHLLRIARVFTRHGLDEFVAAIHLFRPYAFLFRLIPVKRNRELPRGDRLRMALEELGPVFVKFGQILSTRPDLLPDDIALSLTRLQDQVPPFPGDQAIKIIEKAYGHSIDGHFRKFEKESTASASVAQVHYAELHDGSEVIVKVLRPGIERVIDRDLALLHTLAELAERHWSQGQRLKPREIVEDYDQTIHDELDMMREGASASQLRINFEGSDLIYVPEVHWEHTCREVLVMERIYGIPIRDVDKLKAAGIDMKKLAHAGVEIFFTQAFRDGFFHADMHPGNIFVSESGQYRAVDFGIMGTLGTADKRYLAENLLAFFNRDYHRVADAHIRAGWVPPNTNAEQFEAAIRTVCEPIFSRPISEISFGAFLIDLFRVARRFNMPVQPQLVLLQKTILNIEGLGRQLYPELDLWDTAKPFLEKWMNDQVGPRAAIRAIRRELPNLFTLAPELPGLTHQLMYKLKNDELTFRTRDGEVEALILQMAFQHRKTTKIVTGIGLIIATLILLPEPRTIIAMSVAGWLGLAGGAALLLAGLMSKPPKP